MNNNFDIDKKDNNGCQFCGSKDNLVKIESFSRPIIMCHKCRKAKGLLTSEETIDIYSKNLKTPTMIIKELDNIVIGQTKAKMKLATELYKHQLRIINPNLGMRKNNVLLMGPTGCGKSHLVESICKSLSVPFCIVSATSFSEVGYAGNDVETMLISLMKKAGNVIQAECGIILIDEIDKLAKSENTQKDIKLGVQQALLKIVEGCDVDIATSQSAATNKIPSIQVDTRKILFIGCGAFEGIEEIIKARLNKSGTIGFMGSGSSTNSLSPDELRDAAIDQDYIKFGLIPELVGRFPIRSNLHELTKEDLKKIILADDGILKEYSGYFEAMNLNSKDFINDDILDILAAEAYSSNTGARSLRTICSNTFDEAIVNAAEIYYKNIIMNNDNTLDNLYEEDSIELKKKSLTL